MRVKLLLLFFVWLLPIRVGLAESPLPKDLSCLPVLIQIPAASQSNKSYVGTGIYLEEANKVFLITAKHAIFDITSTNVPLPLINTNAMVSAWSRDTKNSRKNMLSLNLGLANVFGYVRQHHNRDIAAIYMGNSFTNADGTAKTHFSRFISQGPDELREIVVWRPEDTINSNEVFEGADSLMLGYPVELLEESSEVAFDRALLRRSMISQKHPDTGKFVVDSGVYGGNSGGPLLIVQHDKIAGRVKYLIAGIMVKFVPAQTRVFPNTGFTNSVLVFSGYSVAEPISGAIELMRQ